MHAWSPCRSMRYPWRHRSSGGRREICQRKLALSSINIWERMKCFDRKKRRDQLQIKLVCVYNLFPNSHISYLFTLIQSEPRANNIMRMWGKTTSTLSISHNTNILAISSIISAQKYNNGLNYIPATKKTLFTSWSRLKMNWKNTKHLHNYGRRDIISTLRRWCAIVCGNFWWIYTDSKFPSNGKLPI
jgi:hypothetical protein